MADDAAGWRAWKRARDHWLADKGHNTAQVYRAAWRGFFIWAGVPPWQVTPELAGGWAAHLAAAGLAASTIRIKLSALASFYDFVGAHGRPGGQAASLDAGCGDGGEPPPWSTAGGNPFDAVEAPLPRRPYRRPRPLGRQEVRAMLAAINPKCLTGARDYALLLTLLLSGRRASQVLAMRWGDLERLAEGGLVFTYRGARGELSGAVLPGPCHQAICGYLEMTGRSAEHMRPDAYVFAPLNPERVRQLPAHAGAPARPNRPLSVSFANRILKKYARRAGLDPARANLRAWCRAGRSEGGKTARTPGR